jgi:hypothetical protein
MKMSINIKINNITYSNVNTVKLPLSDGTGYATFVLNETSDDNTENAPGDTPSGSLLPSNGLIDYFDFRNCEYNNAGSGGSTIVSSSEGSGGLYCWANNAVTVITTALHIPDFNGNFIVFPF